MFPLARSANIIYRKQISLQYYSRASVNVTAPQGARKRCLRRKHSSKRSAVRMLSPHRNNNSVFSRTCAGKRHPESRERGDERGVHGEKTTERASCEVRLLSSRPSCCHAILITLTDISSPVAADSLHLLIIAPARAAAVFDSPVGGRLGLGSVGVMPSLVMTI